MKDHSNTDKQELAFYKALQTFGYIFPETEDELLKFEESISRMKFVIPEKFNDPIDIIKKGKIEKISHFTTFYNVHIEENLSQAAREGSDIPTDVREQMEKDRKEAEKKRDEKLPE